MMLLMFEFAVPPLGVIVNGPAPAGAEGFGLIVHFWNEKSDNPRCIAGERLRKRRCQPHVRINGGSRRAKNPCSCSRTNGNGSIRNDINDPTAHKLSLRIDAGALSEGWKRTEEQ